MVLLKKMTLKVHNLFYLSNEILVLSNVGNTIVNHLCSLFDAHLSSLENILGGACEVIVNIHIIYIR